MLQPLAISNIERGAGFITGDQTERHWQGPHLRQHHALCPAAGKNCPFYHQGQTPFMPNMMRDVGDIGMQRFTPFITDSSTEIPLPNGAALKTATAAKQENRNAGDDAAGQSGPL